MRRTSLNNSRRFLSAVDTRAAPMPSVRLAFAWGLPAAAGCLVLSCLISPAKAEPKADGIGALIATANAASETAPTDATNKETAPVDPRAGDPHVKQARDLMTAIDDILNNVAQERTAAKKLPGRDEFIVPPIWTETKEDREDRVRALLDAALSIVTDSHVVDIQKRIETHRKNILDLEQRIITLKEKQLTAPPDGMLPGILSDTVASLEDEIADAGKRIQSNKDRIEDAKGEISAALIKSGIKLEPAQLDLLLGSVLSSDLVRLVSAFQAAKLIDGQLAKLMKSTADTAGASRKYFAMHAALFALLVHAQDTAIKKIDTQYLPRLDAILKDLKKAKSQTLKLMRAENRPDQKRALAANRDSQKLAEEAAKSYRRYLRQQREQIAAARARASHDLRIADNTFATVDLSFELHRLMRDSSASFEAIQRLEAPTFEQIFRNEELRREFENLTRKLSVPTS